MSAAPSTPDLDVAVQTGPDTRTRPRRVPPYHVVLENDDHHSFEFVVEVLTKALGCSFERAFQLTTLAHSTGRAVVWTGSKEVAELKVDQIHSFSEIRSDGAKLGPLGATIEPAA